MICAQPLYTILFSHQALVLGDKSLSQRNDLSSCYVPWRKLWQLRGAVTSSCSKGTVGRDHRLDRPLTELSAKPPMQLRDVLSDQNPRRLLLSMINNHRWVRHTLAPFQVRQRVNDVAVGGEHSRHDRSDDLGQLTNGGVQVDHDKVLLGGILDPPSDLVACEEHKARRFQMVGNLRVVELLHFAQHVLQLVIGLAYQRWLRHLFEPDAVDEFADESF
jgi:hypothetical protein